MRVGSEYWWVIGSPERNAYMHWKGDCVSGCYTDSVLSAAEKFTSSKAAKEAMSDEDVARYLSGRAGMGFRVCRVNVKTYVN